MSQLARIAPAEFGRRLARLKAELGVNFEQDVADALGLSLDTMRNLRLMGFFPEKELRALTQLRPELGIDVEYVLFGRLQKVRASLGGGVSAREKTAPGRDELLREALERQVPSMAYGFRISTLEGDIDVGTSSFAVVMQALVRAAIMDELLGGKAG